MLIHYVAYLKILRHNEIIEGIQQYLEAYNDYKRHTKISLVKQRSLSELWPIKIKIIKYRFNHMASHSMRYQLKRFLYP